MDKVRKTWGYEHWFANTDDYCGKLLYVDENEWSSKGAYHYHKIKHETFFVIEGTLLLDYVTEDGIFARKTLEKYESFVVPQGMKHKFTAIGVDGCKFIEASTTHRDSDSYRVIWDIERQSWEPV